MHCCSLLRRTLYFLCYSSPIKSQPHGPVTSCRPRCMYACLYVASLLSPFVVYSRISLHVPFRPWQAPFLPWPPCRPFHCLQSPWTALPSPCTLGSSTVSAQPVYCHIPSTHYTTHFRKALTYCAALAAMHQSLFVIPVTVALQNARICPCVRVGRKNLRDGQPQNGISAIGGVRHRALVQ